MKFNSSLFPLLKRLLQQIQKLKLGCAHDTAYSLLNTKKRTPVTPLCGAVWVSFCISSAYASLCITAHTSVSFKPMFFGNCKSACVSHISFPAAKYALNKYSFASSPSAFVFANWIQRWALNKLATKARSKSWCKPFFCLLPKLSPNKNLHNFLI